MPTREFAPIYREGMAQPECEGWAEVIDRDPVRYLPNTGMRNPYVFGHVRFVGSDEVVGRLIRLDAIRLELPPEENGNDRA